MGISETVIRSTIAPPRSRPYEAMFKGDPGEAFTFEKFTSAQLALLKGDPQQEATPLEVSAGTGSKYVSPAALAGSIYRRIYIQAQEPADPLEGDLWIIKP